MSKSHDKARHRSATEIRRTPKTSQHEYFDIMLLHWQHTDTWPADTVRWQDGIMEAQHRQAIRKPRRLDARFAGIATGAADAVARRRDDSHESQRRQHGREDYNTQGWVTFLKW